MPAYNKTALGGGAFQDNQGNPLSNGFITLTLSHDACLPPDATNPSQIPAGITTKMALDANGNLVPQPRIWTNDILIPLGSYYVVMAYNYKGLAVWAAPQKWSINASGGVVDVGSIVPLTP